MVFSQVRKWLIADENNKKKMMMMPKVFTVDKGSLEFLNKPVLLISNFPGIEIDPTTNQNLDSNNKRKLLRRAANRRSAQLSRARKKVFIMLLIFQFRF
jgi:hypothetical protein